MTKRPAALEAIDHRSGAAELAHAAAADFCRDVAERGTAADHALALLRESAALALVQIPALMHDLRRGEQKWEEQELLDPAAAERTAQRLADEVSEILPAISKLRARQNEIVAELRALAGDDK